MKQLRTQLKKSRRQLSYFEQQKAERAVFQHLIDSAIFKNSKKVGIYLHAFGEVSTRLIILYCFKLKKEVYLPRICPIKQQLLWVKITNHQYLKKQFYKHPLGMYEPFGRGHLVNYLDLLIMPLVGCDLIGTRMGMGGGYYDRTLANSSHSPYRLGLAHNFQLLPFLLKRQIWDQPLDAVCTPKKLIFFKRLPQSST